MKHQTVIQWDQAQHEANQLRAKEETNQKQKLQEFLESNCDIFDSRDFQYYAQKTGKSIEWLMENAKYSEEDHIGNSLNNAMLDGDLEMMSMLLHDF